LTNGKLFRGLKLLNQNSIEFRSNALIEVYDPENFRRRKFRLLFESLIEMKEDEGDCFLSL